MLKLASALILTERYIQLPVQLVLDRPIALDDRGELLDRHFPAQNVVADTDAFLTFTLGVTDDHADRLEPRPTVAVGKPSRYAADVVPSRFPPDMALVRTVPAAHRHRQHLAIKKLGENFSIPSRSVL